MKKLTIAAAVAAMSAASFAAVPEAQVYDVALTIKTTKAAQAKNVTNKSNPFAYYLDEEDCSKIALGKDDKATIIYRAQTSITWKGLIWGCDCEAIDGVWENAKYCGETTCTIKGCVLWDVKGKEPVYFGNVDGAYDTEGATKDTLDEVKDKDGDPYCGDYLENTVCGSGWGWKFLQLIGKDAKSVEGAWRITSQGLMCDPDCTLCDDDCGKVCGTLFEFVGAGFGSVNLVTSTDDDGLKNAECESYVKSISGNFAGWMNAPAATLKLADAGCTFCRSWDEVSGCSYAQVWKWCEEFNDVDCATCGLEYSLYAEDETAAYGTWSIKYNSSLSKKLTKATSILDAYNFKSLPKVSAKIAIAEEVSNDYLNAIANAETDLDNAKAAVTTAEENLAEAEADRETKYAAQTVAEAAQDTAEKKFRAASLVYNSEGTEAYNVYKATYEINYGTWQGSATYWNCWTNNIVASKEMVAAQEVYQFADTNLVPKAEAAVTSAEKAVTAAEETLKAAKEDCAKYCD